ncbi:MAG: hypothetical protein ABI175_05115, partial [Polyangiales bacterium]
IPSEVPRFALAIGAWLGAVALRVAPVFGARRWQFIALACALTAPAFVCFARTDLDVTIAEQWHYVNGTDDGGELGRFLFRLLVAPVVALIAGAIAFHVVSAMERPRFDRAIRMLAPIVTAGAAGALVLAMLRVRSLPEPFSRRIEMSDLDIGVNPAAWVPVAEHRWEIAGDESTLVLEQGSWQTATTGHSVSATVRRRDGTVDVLDSSLGPRVEIRRDDRSEVWLVGGNFNHDQPPLGRTYIAQHGYPREKLTVTDLVPSMSAPKPTRVLAASGAAAGALLLAIGAVLRRRATAVGWRNARIAPDRRLALEDGTELALGEATLGDLVPGAAVLVTLRPETEPPLEYRRVPIVDRVKAGSLEEQARTRRGTETALATWAIAIVSISSASLLAAFTLGFGAP